MAVEGIDIAGLSAVEPTEVLVVVVLTGSPVVVIFIGSPVVVILIGFPVVVILIGSPVMVGFTGSLVVVGFAGLSVEGFPPSLVKPRGLDLVLVVVDGIAYVVVTAGTVGLLVPVGSPGGSALSTSLGITCKFPNKS